MNSRWISPALISNTANEPECQRRDPMATRVHDTCESGREESTMTDADQVVKLIQHGSRMTDKRNVDQGDHRVQTTHPEEQASNEEGGRVCEGSDDVPADPDPKTQHKRRPKENDRDGGGTQSES